MSISGLVVTLADDAAAEAALASLATDPRLSIGDRFDRRVAVVADTPSPQADLDLWDQLRRTPGIENIDVTFVHLDSDAEAPSGPGHPVSDHGSMEKHHAHG